MKYKEAITCLESLKKHGIKLRLENVQKVLERFNSPHKKLKIIHITGSKGKTSVAYYINSILLKANFKVGLFTSPYLLNLQNSLKINNKAISNYKLAFYFTKIKDYLVEYDLTFFETLTVLSFLFFYQEKTDFSIFETGLGGRQDATNVGAGFISVITNIEKEHTDILGKSLEKIAYEKIGIIKPKSIVINGVTQPQIIKLIKNKCQKEKTKFINVDNTFLHKFSPSLLGEHQKRNVLIAYHTILALKSYHINITLKTIFKAIKKTYLPGRIEIVSFNPLIILDGAHTPLSILNLKNTIQKNFKYNSLFIVFGCQRNKQFKEIIKILKTLSPLFIITKSSHPLALNYEPLVSEVNQIGGKVLTFGTIEKVFGYLQNKIHKDDLLCITGSLYLVANFMDFFLKIGIGKKEWTLY